MGAVCGLCAKSEEDEVKLSDTLLGRVSMISRHSFKELFGELEYEKNGHFVDHQMGQLIHRYHFDNFHYPDGDQNININNKDPSEYVCGALSHCGRLFYTEINPGYISVIDLAFPKEGFMHQWDAYDKNIHRLATHANGLLASVGDEPMINIWDGYKFILKLTLKGHTEMIFDVSFHNSGDYLVSSSHDRTLRLWSLHTGESIRVFEPLEHGIMLSNIFIGDTIVSCTTSNHICGWDMNDDDQKMKFEKKYQWNFLSEPEIYHLSVNSDSTLLLGCGKSDGTAWNWPELTKGDHQLPRTNVGCFHPSNPSLLALATLRGPGNYHQIVVFNYRSSILRAFRGHKQKITHLSFTPDGNHLVSASKGSIRVWNVTEHINELSQL